MRAERNFLTKNKWLGADIVDPTPWETDEDGCAILHRCPICEKAVYAGEKVCVTDDMRRVLHESCAVYRRSDMTVGEVLDRLGVELYSAVAGEFEE